MSTNCVNCVERERTGPDMLCDVCRATPTTPTGLHNIAQGCAPSATLGNESEKAPNPEGVAPFAVGDKVQWTHTSSNGNSFRFRTREGTIESLNNWGATVKMRNGRKSSVSLKQLRRQGQQSELTEFVTGLGKPMEAT